MLHSQYQRLHPGTSGTSLLPSSKLFFSTNSDTYPQTYKNPPSTTDDVLAIAKRQYVCMIDTQNGTTTNHALQAASHESHASTPSKQPWSPEFGDTTPTKARKPLVIFHAFQSIFHLILGFALMLRVTLCTTVPVSSSIGQLSLCYLGRAKTTFHVDSRR